MSEGVYELVADRLRRVERLGALTRLVFAIQRGDVGDDELTPTDVVSLVVPTEALSEIAEAIRRAGPPLRAVRTGQGLELVPGGRDMVCTGKC